MSQVVSTRLPDRTAERLKRFARRLGKTPSETSAILIEESLRESEFPYIEFRHSPLGRQPYLKNSSLALWEVIQIAQSYALDEQKNGGTFSSTPRMGTLCFALCRSLSVRSANCDRRCSNPQ